MQAAGSFGKNAREFELGLEHGFGLIELVVTMAIAAVLLALAIPSFREIGMRMNLTENNNDLIGALTTAKSQAVKLGVQAGVVGLSGGNDWSSGWQVRVDSNNDNALTTADTIIATYPAVANQYKITSKVTGGADAQVIFSSLGYLLAPATLADINVCRPDHNAAESLWIHVTSSGEVKSQRNTSTSPAPGC
ncbi:MAG TPA: GspH/FimT family protein [Rhodanobacteraceae bacterium]|jgi:type IV fimbrial biogenesis protein FimT|nr:GspH/FimT family protein [Rhodanobacteraceae bacterium]